MCLPNRKAGLSILVIDDNADCAESMALLLRLCGHEVEVADTGLGAHERLNSRHYDVALLEIRLPGGMNGWEVAERVVPCQCGKRPFLIAVTGYGQECDRCHSRASGIDLHLTKPIDPDGLESVLKRLQGLMIW